jgi:hypothetical protein
MQGNYAKPLAQIPKSDLFVNHTPSTGTELSGLIVMRIQTSLNTITTIGEFLKHYVTRFACQIGRFRKIPACIIPIFSIYIC